MDDGDFYVGMYPETYAFDTDEIEDDEKEFTRIITIEEVTWNHPS